MKIPLLLISLVLAGCANSGIRYYEPVTKSDKAGHKYQKQELVAAIETDMPGITDLSIGKLHVSFSGQTMQVQEAVFDRKGAYVATLNQSYLPGMYSSHTIKAKGEAATQMINAGAAGATGVVGTVIGGIVTGGVASWLK